MGELVNQNVAKVGMAGVYNGKLYDLTLDATGRLLVSDNSGGSGGGTTPADTLVTQVFQTSGTPGTQVQATSQACRKVIISNPDADDPQGSATYTANTGKIHVGVSGNPFAVLWPGDSLVLEIEDADLLYFTSDVASQYVLLGMEVVS